MGAVPVIRIPSDFMKLANIWCTYLFCYCNGCSIRRRFSIALRVNIFRKFFAIPNIAEFAKFEESWHDSQPNDALWITVELFWNRCQQA